MPLRTVTLATTSLVPVSQAGERRGGGGGGMNRRGSQRGACGAHTHSRRAGASHTRGGVCAVSGKGIPAQSQVQ